LRPDNRQKVPNATSNCGGAGTTHSHPGTPAQSAHRTLRTPSNATIRLLGEMHYRAMLRVMRREKGIRIHGAHEHLA
jgi:hypothetical protein